jgi:hypothetical protein
MKAIPANAEGWRRRRSSGNTCLLIGLALALGALFFFDPAQHSLYPQCPLKRATGWDCPGCGGLRATHALLHGRIAEAFAFNPLLFFLSPLSAFVGIAFWWERRSGRTVLPAWFRSSWPWWLLAVVIGFGVGRNLPWRAWLGIS